MAPTLNQIILNGASRHRLNKGFMLVGDGRRPVEVASRDEVVRAVNQQMAGQEYLRGFGAEGRAEHPSLVGLVTPFLHVYDPPSREAFINKLATGTNYLRQAAYRAGYRLMTAGVNPYSKEGGGQAAALCADYHQVEVYDDGEIERIYNLYRQFLPELLAISAHASVYGGEVQKDFSTRMRLSPSSFLPRYLSQFTYGHLRRLERMMRKDYGLADLRQMDVNPLGGDPGRLTQTDSPLLGETAAAVELRFVDSQCSYPFIRAQIILFQAVAVYGRSLARQGKRLPFMHDEVIDVNKALAIQGGAGAILKPDPKFKQDGGGRGFWYHDRGTPERATTALLSVVEGLLLQALRDLRCRIEELAPIILGAELRRRGKRCLGNYAEYQQYVYYTHRRDFPNVFQQHVEHLLSSPALDYAVDYNRATYADLAAEIEREWAQRLAPRARLKGQVVRYDRQRRSGLIHSDGGEFPVQQSDVEGAGELEYGQTVTFEILERRGRKLAVRVRPQAQPRHTGRVLRLDKEKGFGFVADDAGGEEVFIHHSDAPRGWRPRAGDQVSFEVVSQPGKGPRAVRIQVIEQPRLTGTVKWFDPKRRFGYISTEDGKEVFVHQDELEDAKAQTPGQRVSFEVGKSDRGPRATRVRSLE